ncbi:MAG: helix-turn-helix domain-containing protein [Candidatus Nanopelagicales bacterium]
MTDVKTSTRRDRAARTRRAILDAAHAEFLERGYHGATISAIASRAGVAPQTVYFVFHTKAELVSAVIDDRVLGPDLPTVQQESPWWAAMLAAPTAATALEQFVRGAAPLLARAAPVSEVVRAAALTDDEVRAIHDHHDRMQIAGYRQVIDIVAGKGPLRPDLTPETATHVLLTLCGDSVWVQLTDRGWTPDQITRWLAAAAPASILQLS